MAPEAKRLRAHSDSCTLPAVAPARHDGDLLDAAASRLADLGALSLAADTAAQALGEHARTGDRGKEVESSIRAYGLASHPERVLSKTTVGACQSIWRLQWK